MIPTINIAVVAPTPPVEARLFIVAVQSQEAALLPGAGPLGARVSPTAVVVVVVGNHCALMPAALMIGHHLSISAFW